MGTIFVSSRLAVSQYWSYTGNVYWVAAWQWGRKLNSTNVTFYPPLYSYYVDYDNQIYKEKSHKWIRRCSHILSDKNEGSRPLSPLCQPISAIPWPPILPFSANISICPPSPLLLHHFCQHIQYHPLPKRPFCLNKNYIIWPNLSVCQNEPNKTQYFLPTFVKFCQWCQH